MKPSKDILSDLIDITEAGKHRQFQLIRSWREYRNLKKLRRTHVLLVGSLKQSLRAQLKKYCNAVEAGETNIINLLAYCTLKDVLDFYKEELSILEDMLDEYECYLAHGNWTDFIFAAQRPLDKLWDHRGK